MIRIAAVLFGSLGLGALLALTWAAWPVWPGAVGAALLVLVACLVRWRWARGADAIDAPGPYERRAWHSLASLGVVASHLVASLSLGLDLHVGSGNTLAIDNWLLVLGAALSWLILRPRVMDRDERDAEMANRGAHAGYRVLIGLLAILLLGLGFAPIAVTERMTPFVIGNVLVVLILASGLAAFATQLRGYAASRPGARDD